MFRGWQGIIEKWKAKGFVTYLELRQTLPPEILDQDQVDDIATMINDMGIEVRKEKAEVINLQKKNNEE